VGDDQGRPGARRHHLERRGRRSRHGAYA
jgi:hypothetical protein